MKKNKCKWKKKECLVEMGVGEPKTRKIFDDDERCSDIKSYVIKAIIGICITLGSISKIKGIK